MGREKTKEATNQPAGASGAPAVTEPAAKEAKIPERGEIDAQYQWNLADLYRDDAAWETDVQALGPLLAEVGKCRGRLTSTIKNLADCLNQYFGAKQKITKIYAYASRQ